MERFIFTKRFAVRVRPRRSTARFPKCHSDSHGVCRRRRRSERRERSGVLLPPPFEGQVLLRRRGRSRRFGGRRRVKRGRRLFPAQGQRARSRTRQRAE